MSGSGWANRDNEYITHGFTYDGVNSPGPCPVNCTNNNEVYSFHPGGVACSWATLRSASSHRPSVFEKSVAC